MREVLVELQNERPPILGPVGPLEELAIAAHWSPRVIEAQLAEGDGDAFRGMRGRLFALPRERGRTRGFLFPLPDGAALDTRGMLVPIDVLQLAGDLWSGRGATVRALWHDVGPEQLVELAPIRWSAAPRSLETVLGPQPHVRLPDHVLELPTGTIARFGFDVGTRARAHELGVDERRRARDIP